MATINQGDTVQLNQSQMTLTAKTVPYRADGRLMHLVRITDQHGFSYDVSLPASFLLKV